MAFRLFSSAAAKSISSAQQPLEAEEDAAISSKKHTSKAEKRNNNGHQPTQGNGAVRQKTQPRANGVQAKSAARGAQIEHKAKRADSSEEDEDEGQSGDSDTGEQEEEELEEEEGQMSDSEQDGSDDEGEEDSQQGDTESEEGSGTEDSESDDEEDGDRRGQQKLHQTFASLGLAPWIQQQCKVMGMPRPTEIQSLCVPEILKGMRVSELDVSVSVNVIVSVFVVVVVVVVVGGGEVAPDVCVPGAGAVDTAAVQGHGHAQATGFRVCACPRS